jgi:hypothetical protein
VNDDPNDWFKRQLIARAQRGDAEAGCEILREIALAIDAGGFDPILFPFHAECLWLFMQGAPLDKALCVKGEDQGGRPRKYDELELAAVDILLRDHAKLSVEDANAWIGERIGTDRTTVQRVRKNHDARYNPEAQQKHQQLMEAADRELLLHRSGSLRPIVAAALPDPE